MVEGRVKYGPFLILLSPEQLAVMTLHSAVMSLMKGENITKPSVGSNKARSFGGQCILSSLSVNLGKVRCNAHFAAHVIQTGMTSNRLGKGQAS